MTPVDLTNWERRLQLRKKAGDAVYLDLSTENTRLALSGNRIQIAIPPRSQSLWPRLAESLTLCCVPPSEDTDCPKYLGLK